MKEKKYEKYGSPAGLVLTIGIGFALYFLLQAVHGQLDAGAYAKLTESIYTPKNQFLWFLINWTEPEFFAGPISTIFLFVGAIAAWLLSISKSRFAGIEICYGSARIWPWVFASQILSLLLTQYLFGYIHLFDLGLSWIPTFIVIVSVPPSMVLMYGPGLVTLLTASILGAVLCTPTAYWISTVTASWNIPGATNNVFCMVISGCIAGCVCRVLPWMKKREIPATNNTNDPGIDYKSPFWILRRTVADFTEPQFYGNDIAGLFVIVGVIIDWLIHPSLLCGGANMLPAILLSQFISGGLGVFLYTGRYQERGWYGTYVPVVCTSPACVLLFGATMPVILVSGILGGIIGAPIAHWIEDRRPEYIHGTVPNVLAMTISTVIVAAVISCISWL